MQNKSWIGALREVFNKIGDAQSFACVMCNVRCWRKQTLLHPPRPNCNRAPGYSNGTLRLVVVRTGPGITAMRGSLEQFSDLRRIRNTT